MTILSIMNFHDCYNINCMKAVSYLFYLITRVADVELVIILRTFFELYTCNTMYKLHFRNLLNK